MATLREQLDRLTGLQHRLAVWESVYANLEDNFVSKDVGRPAPKAIRVPGCIVEKVPEEVLEEILKEIAEGPVKDMKEEITQIEGQQVVVMEAKS